VTGDLWIGTLGAGLLRNSAGRRDRFTQFNSGLAGDVLFDVKVWGGRIFAATTRGISGYDPRTETWTLHLPRRGDIAPVVIVRFLVLPSDSSLYACAFHGSPFRHDAGTDAWLPSGDRAARTACESVQNEKAEINAPRPPERPEPSSETTAAIGILIPMSRTISVPGADRPWPDERVDRVAIEELLALRTKRGEAPIELSASAFTYERHGFGTPDDTLAILARRPEVAGVVGHDVPYGSVESILASRLGMPIVDAAPGESGSGAIEDPWVFRCDRYGHDGQVAVLDALLVDLDHPRLAVVRTPGGEAARRLDFWVGRAAKRGAQVVVDVIWDPDVDDLGAVLTKLRRARVQAVMTWSDARASAALLGGMRKEGLRAALVGGPRIVNEEFAKSAPPDVGTVLAVAPCPHAEAVGGPPPESLHDRSSGAAAHLIAAVESAGRDREAVRGALQSVRSQAVARLKNGAWGQFSYGQARPSRGVPFDRVPSGPSPDGHAFVARTR
jgi:hypothetical protein